MIQIVTSQELTITRFSRENIARFFSKIRIDPAVEFKGIPCWLWTAALCKPSKGRKDMQEGYGFFWWKGRNHYAYRVAYAWLVEPAPAYPSSGWSLDHLCRNRKCCNPTHLEKVPIRINILRGVGRTAQLAAQTHCKNGHLLPAPNVRNERICLICKNSWTRDWRKARRDEPYSQTTKARIRYQTDPEFRAREVQRKRDYDARLPVEVKRERQKRYDAQKRAKKLALRLLACLF